jgi:hypothetical protein
MPKNGSRPVSVAAAGTSVPVESVAFIDAPWLVDTVQESNAKAWRHIAEFLDSQWLASLGCRLLTPAESMARRGPACGVGPRNLSGVAL